MNYVKNLKYKGVRAKEIPSITGNGAPTKETEGAVGCLYMDEDTGAMYKCTAANDGVYTWVLMSSTYFGAPYESAEAVFDISGNRDESLKLYLFGNSSGKYDAVVRGTGTMTNRGENSVEYKAYVPYISRLHIEAGVTDIGSFFMYGAYNLQDLSFADSTAITHLGSYAFAKTLIGSEYDFSGLTDTTLSGVFSGCVKLEGITLSGTIAEIKGANADTATTLGGTFQDCFALRYVRGLTGLRTISGLAGFYNCISLQELDVIPGNVSVGKTAFAHVSSDAVVRGTNTKLYEAEWRDTDTFSFVQNTWTPEQLSAIKATTGESKMLPVPLYDAQTDDFYMNWNILWTGSWDDDEDGDGKSDDGLPDYIQLSPVGPAACGLFTLYHIYNSIHSNAQYKSFKDFVEMKINKSKFEVTQSLHDTLMNDRVGKLLPAANPSASYEVGSKITAFDLPFTLPKCAAYGEEGTAFWGICQALGWTPTYIPYNEFEDGKSVAKQKIIESIAAGKPVFTNMVSRWVGEDGEDAWSNHAVTIIGYDNETDKFLIVNSFSDFPASVYPMVYWNEFEALTMPYEATGAMTFDFGEDITMTRIDEKLDELLRGQNLRMKTGTFAPATDVRSINLEIEPGAKYVFIKSVTEPKPRQDDDYDVAVMTLMAMDEFIGRHPNEPECGALVFVDKGSGPQYAMFPWKYDVSNGFSVVFTAGDYTVFEGGMTYEWEAHWWND